MGYDISDYRDIHAPYGTVSDVDELIVELHKRGMKLMLDLVVRVSFGVPRDNIQLTS